MADDDDGPVEWETTYDFQLDSHLGKQSIEIMIEAAAGLRKYTKERVKAQDSYGITPVVREHAKRSVARFTQFRLHVLKHADLKKPIVTEDIAAFIESLSTTIKGLHESGKPTFGAVLNVTTHVLEWARFTFGHDPNFKIRTEKIRSSLQGLRQAKLVIVGTQLERTWLGFSTLTRMAQTWLDDAVVKGTRNMDVTILRLLSVVLISSCGIRAGEATLSQGYTDEFMRYKDITIELHPDTDLKNPKVSDLRMTVRLRCLKGEKESANTGKNFPEKYHRTLSEGNSHVDPIKLTITHVLRNKLVEATNITDLLRGMASRNDLRLVWLYPEFPVLCQLDKSNSSIHLDRPASPRLVLRAAQLMGTNAKILGRVCSHAFRLGYARDVAHLSKDIEGASSLTISEVLNHNLDRGPQLAAHYAGGISSDLNSLREDNRKKSHKREPKFADVRPTDAFEYFENRVKRQCLSDQVLRDFFHKQWPDGLSRQKDWNKLSTNQVYYVRRMYNADQENMYKTTADVEHISRTKEMADRQPLMPLSTSLSVLKVNASQLQADMQVGHTSPMVAKPQSNPKSGGPTSITSKAKSTPGQIALTTAVETVDEPGFLSNLDPALLETSDLNGDSRNETDMAQPEHVAAFLDLFVDDGIGGDHEDDTIVTARINEALAPDAVPTVELEDELEFEAGDKRPILPGAEFIEYFSRFNVCKSEKYGLMHMRVSGNEAKLFEAFKDTGDPAFGGSRDFPTPFVWRCFTAGCGREFTFFDALKSHMQTCTTERIAKEHLVAEQEELFCDYAGCTFSTRGGAKTTPQASLNRHINCIHKFTPVMCPEEDCSTRPRLFETADKLKDHKKSHADKLDCPLDCGSALARRHLKNHLNRVHGIIDPVRLQELMPARKKKAKYEPKL